MGKKVLVRSRHREVTAQVTRDLSKDEKGRVVETNHGFRQFLNNLCYMTMEEAANLIDSPENVAYIDQGLPPLYSYPAGMPVPVDEDHDGPLAPPMSGSGLVANNALQNEAARRVSEAADEQIAKRKRAEASSAKTPQALAARAQSQQGEEGSGAYAEPIRIVNPDLDAEADTMADVPVFRDEKAAAERV